MSLLTWPGPGFMFGSYGKNSLCMCVCVCVCVYIPKLESQNWMSGSFFDLFSTFFFFWENLQVSQQFTNSTRMTDSSRKWDFFSYLCLPNTSVNYPLFYVGNADLNLCAWWVFTITHPSPFNFTNKLLFGKEKDILLYPPPMIGLQTHAQPQYQAFGLFVCFVLSICFVWIVKIWTQVLMLTFSTPSNHLSPCDSLV